MNNAENSAAKGFQLINGISLSDTRGLGEFYKKADSGFWIYPSAENMCALALSVVKELYEPMFFFLELPCRNDEDAFDLYYLECTKPVAEAIIKRYGDLLINDGISRFGFGSHKTGDEIYFHLFQRVFLFTESTEKYEKILKALEISDDPANTVADNFDPDMDEVMPVELDGETVYDAVENLKSAGLYFDKKIKF